MALNNSEDNAKISKPSIGKVLFASYAIAMAVFIVLVSFCFLFFGPEVLEKYLFENVELIVLATGAIAFPFIHKYLK